MLTLARKFDNNANFKRLTLIYSAGLLVWPVALLAHAVVSLPKRSGSMYVPPWLLHLALFTWLAIFVVQAHKEERFLFPIYPLICLAAAASIDYLQKLYYHLFVRVKARHYLEHTNYLSVGMITFCPMRISK